MIENELVIDHQTMTMINVFGENLMIVTDEESHDLSDLRLDVGLVQQNEPRDLLFNSNHYRHA